MLFGRQSKIFHKGWRWAIRLSMCALHLILLGSVSASHSRSVQVRLRIEESVRLSPIEDFDAGLWSRGDGSIHLQQSVCVYSNSGGYEVSFQSAAGSGFRLQQAGSASAALPYEVQWRHGSQRIDATPARRERVHMQTASCTQSGNDNNATLSVNIAESDLERAAGGTYADTLLVVLSPQ